MGSLREKKEKAGRKLKKAVAENNDAWDVIVDEVLMEDYKRISGYILQGTEVEKNLAIVNYIKTIGSNITKLISLADKAEEADKQLIKEKASSDVLRKVTIV